MNNLIYWLYGFKYWVTSIEVPSNFKHKNSGKSKQFYNIISWTGIILNFALCVVVGYDRYLLSMSFDNSTYTIKKLDVQLDLAYGVDFLLVVSALFLADALRRLRREFNRNKKFVENGKTMCLHVFIVIGHCFILAFT